MNIKSQILRASLLACFISLTVACGSTSTPAPETAEITDIGEEQASVILDNNNTIEGVAQGKVSYSRSLDAQERGEALRIAKEGLVRKFVAQKMPNLVRNYNATKEEINDNLDELLLSEKIVSEDIDSDNKSYAVTVRAQINEPALLLILNDSDSKMDSAEMTFIFVAREDTAQNLDDYSENEKTQVEWRAMNTKEIDVAMGAVFTDHNFNVVSPAVLELETDGDLQVSAFVKDFEVGDDVSSETLGRAIVGLKELDPPVNFFALGTLDVDRSFVDPVSGNIKVAVSVTGQILNVLKRGSRVAAVGPVQYFGEGTTYAVARNNALKSAATAAAKVLAGQARANSL